MENPIYFGAEHIKARLDREIKYEEDVSSFADITSTDPPGFDAANAAVLTTTKGNDVPFRVGDKIPSENARQILIATTWRSGSSFTGDIIRTFPGTFYSFEPLHYTYRKETNLENHEPAISLLKSLFKCKYDSNALEYFHHASLEGKQFLVDDNTRVWQVCRKLLPNKAACFMPEFYQAVCPLFPIQLIKTVRLRVEYAAKLLADPELVNLKVIVLIRDPRGTMNSRSNSRWCFRDECSNVTRTCQDLDRDITWAYTLRDRYPGRIYLVRYEDLSLNPYERVKNILQFLELPQNSGVNNFIKTHTETDQNPTVSQNTKQGTGIFVDPSGTYRNSKTTAFAWRHQMDLEKIHRIQEMCAIPMEKGGYKLIDTMKQKYDPDFQVISKTVEDIWPWETV
ncbi:hypothetical protein TCAL_08236 [Tigriopus californicus]|uniref:Sulfotransferase domain-containing protein n=2 Tax=Tigriopus californicus TaxID=6832 RepID=A0A553NF13_TIGCA|nr:hypothetical protein TCAL_08236 [Tigriopus californicus]|eukprot:TCALIF_08236-PA protein Name:"Similar to Chst1 Carbohydrate sulfotransferase 1 (Mus musculus)" AED:0.02 eAED:0.05 QI:0/-1/0/1/-1/1/1/0/395